MSNWSKPYYGISHLGDKSPRLTITDWADHGGNFVELDRWFPGCGFSPLKSTHASAADARAFGEAWLKSQGVA